jgi:hypothetical protein
MIPPVLDCIDGLNYFYSIFQFYVEWKYQLAHKNWQHKRKGNKINEQQYDASTD